MTEGITASLIIAVGIIIAATIGTLLAHRRRKQQESTQSENTNVATGEQSIRDITGVWQTEYENGLTSIDTLIIEKQRGREVSGRRILKHPETNSTREYIFQGFFTGDLLSGAMVHRSNEESRAYAFTPTPEGIELPPGTNAEATERRNNRGDRIVGMEKEIGQ